MNLIFEAYSDSAGCGDVVTIVERDRERAERNQQEALRRIFWRGTAGAATLDQLDEYRRRLGSGPMFREARDSDPSDDEPREESGATAPHPAASASSADQAREVLAALSLNKTQLADVLLVSRPTLYQWLDGQEPNFTNAQRLSTMARLLRSEGVTSLSPLLSRFVRQPLEDGAATLLDLLKADVLDEQEVSRLVREAKALGDAAEERRLSRERRLAERGFEEPSSEQRREQLARSVALRDWPRE